MKKIYLISRILLGLLFVVFGSNGLLMILTGSGFIPMPPPNPEVMEKMGGLFKLGYLMPLVKCLEIVAGVLLLSGRFVNLAVVFLGPIVVNILCVHVFIDLTGLPLAVIIIVLFVLVVKNRWNDFNVLLKA